MPNTNTNTNTNTHGSRAWAIFLKIVALTLLPWMAYMTITLFSIDKRLAIIEDRDSPPRWLIEKVERLEQSHQESH